MSRPRSRTDIAGEPHGVSLVVNRERGLVTEQRGLAAQNAHTGGVKGRHPHALRHPPDELTPTRLRISSAALLVKVMARMAKGDSPFSRTNQAILCVRTRVLPEPAPATTSSGPRDG